MIYLDHHAAAPLEPRVRDAMDAARALGWANPSSAHAAGREARAVVERARETVAAAVGVSPSEVMFTSGGTEACNLAVLGLVARPRRIVSTSIEHPAIAEAVALRESEGSEVLRLGLPEGASPSIEQVASALDGADLCALQWVGHETGTILDVVPIARECAARGIPLAVDATQALGKVIFGEAMPERSTRLALDLGALGASAVALASSKIGGPQGVAALVVRRDVTLAPRQIGGGQERGRRAGTPDPVSIAGFAEAVALAPARLAAMVEVAAQRERLEAALVALGAVVNGAAGARVATVTNVSIPGWRGTSLVAALDLEGLCVAHGAACSSGVDEPSKVVLAMAPDAPWRADGALRLSLGPSTTDAEIDEAIAILRRVLARKKRPGSTA